MAKDIDSNVDKFYRAVRSADDVRADLTDIARSFRRVGNTELADELSVLIADLELAVKEMSDVYSSELHEEYKRAVESSNNVLMTALAVVGQAGRESQ